MAGIPVSINMDQQETRDILPLESRAPGTYLAKMMVRGNALLSSVFVKSIAVGATLKVNYYDTTTGDDGEGERYNLQSHALITDTQAGETLRILVPRIHNKPQIEAIVTGGAVEFGVYISVVADFPSEPAPPAAGGYEPAEGTPKTISFSGATSQSLEVTLFSETVPVGAEWRLRRVTVHTRPYGAININVAGVDVGKLLSGPARENSAYVFSPYHKAIAGDLVEVKYNQSHGPVSDIAAFLQYTDN